MSTLNIFRNVQDQVVKSAVNYHSGPYKDLMKLIEFILRKFFKSAAENPMIFVEALFPMRSHSRKNAAIEAEDVKETGLSDDNENRPVSGKILINTSNVLYRNPTRTSLTVLMCQSTRRNAHAHTEGDVMMRSSVKSQYVKSKLNLISQLSLLRIVMKVGALELLNVI